MTQDYAKKHPKAAPASAELPRWVWFIVGFLFGVFAAFLIYLWKYVPSDQASNINRPTADIIANSRDNQSTNNDKNRKIVDFSFYEMFPKANVPVVEEYTATGKKVVVKQNYAYALQAGSFKSRDDADRRRGQLILLNMPVTIKQVTRDNTIWHRVLVGPLNTKLELDRTRSRLAEADIESIQLRLSR